MKKVLQELTGSGSANDKLLIALSAVTKMFVGELVATGGLWVCRCGVVSCQLVAQQQQDSTVLLQHYRTVSDRTDVHAGGQDGCTGAAGTCQSVHAQWTQHSQTAVIKAQHSRK